MKNDTLLHKWYNKTISKEELEEFKKRPEYASLVQLDRETSALLAPDFDAEQVLDEILATPKIKEKEDVQFTQDTSQSPKVRSLSTWIKYAVAASIMLIAGYFMIPGSDNMVRYEIVESQAVEGTLPDQSTFVLEGKGRLEYDQSTWQDKRSVSLEGQAFFSVMKGSTFTVNTTTGSVVVLGTQFTVISDHNIFAVKCKEGKVSVRPKSDANFEEILMAGESLNQTTDGAMITEKKELTKMKNVKLLDVTNKISKHFGVDFLTQNLDIQESLSCNFQHNDLNLALKTTLSPLGIKYNILADNKVQLYK